MQLCLGSEYITRASNMRKHDKRSESRASVHPRDGSLAGDNFVAETVVMGS